MSRIVSPVSSCSVHITSFSLVGYKPGYIPKMDDDDTIEVFELKAPVWEFKFGRLLGDFVSWPWL